MFKVETMSTSWRTHGQWRKVPGAEFATRAEAEEFAKRYNSGYVNVVEFTPAAEGHAKTCQCCGRLIQAKTGRIAHHGYTRPGHGWQTASCMGAKYPPFEVSRDRLGDLLVHLRNYRARMVQAGEDNAAEKRAVPVSVRTKRHPSQRERDEYAHEQVTRANFAEVTRKSVEHERHFRSHSFYTFDDVKKQEAFRLRREVENIDPEIAAQQARYDGWKPVKA